MSDIKFKNKFCYYLIYINNKDIRETITFKNKYCYYLIFQYHQFHHFEINLKTNSVII